jgi:hypothetical protein
VAFAPFTANDFCPFSTCTTESSESEALLTPILFL